MSSKTWLTGLALGAVLALGGATTAKAQDCSARGWQREQNELRKVIYNRGPYSSQADHQRRKMERIRERCGYAGYGWYRGDGDRDDGWIGRRDRDWDRDRWRRGDGDHDRDDRWDDRHRRDGDHDRDDRRRDRDRDHDRDRDRDRH